MEAERNGEEELPVRYSIRGENVVSTGAKSTELGRAGRKGGRRWDIKVAGFYSQEHGELFRFKAGK